MPSAIDAEISNGRPRTSPSLAVAELLKPVDPQAIAQLAQTPEMSAEIYLTSAIVIDEQSYMERAYLDELARLLSLPNLLREKFDNQVLTPSLIGVGPFHQNTPT